MQGRLLGINTAILTRGGGSNGVGFAVPANLVAAVLAQAQNGATRFERPWAGVVGQAVDMGMAEALACPPLPASSCPTCTRNPPLPPRPCRGRRDPFTRRPARRQPARGDLPPRRRRHRREIAVDYWHDGAQKQATATLAPPPQGDRQETTVTDDVALRGLTVARLDPALTADLGLPMNAEGVVVLDARDRAAQAGLRPGDLLLGINGLRSSLRAMWRRWPRWAPAAGR